MMENLPGFPDTVVAVSAKGRVSRADYETILIPAVEQALERHPKIRFWYELGPEFTGLDAGAAWEDFKVGMRHLTRWERMAVVTDVEWIRHAVDIFRFLMPGDMRSFPVSERASAREWITS